MLKAGFISITDIPRTADRAASRTFYTWRVHQDSMAEKIGIDTLHSMFNIARRLSVESHRNSEVRSSHPTHGLQRVHVTIRTEMPDRHVIM